MRSSIPVATPDMSRFHPIRNRNPNVAGADFNTTARFQSVLTEVQWDPAGSEAAGALMKSPFRFAQRGECGMWVSDVMPHFARQVDKVALIRSMHTSNLTHEPALYKIHSGRELPNLPSLGTWITFGLGADGSPAPDEADLQTAPSTPES